MVVQTGKINLFQMFLLEFIPRLYHFPIKIKLYVPKPKSCVRSICYILSYN